MKSELEDFEEFYWNSDSESEEEDGWAMQCNAIQCNAMQCDAK